MNSLLHQGGSDNHIADVGRLIEDRLHYRIAFDLSSSTPCHHNREFLLDLDKFFKKGLHPERPSYIIPRTNDEDPPAVVTSPAGLLHHRKPEFLNSSSEGTSLDLPVPRDRDSAALQYLFLFPLVLDDLQYLWRRVDNISRLDELFQGTYVNIFEVVGGYVASRDKFSYLISVMEITDELLISELTCRGIRRGVQYGNIKPHLLRFLGHHLAQLPTADDTYS
ncbi:MAG: hypothetical protein DDT24_00682 [Chloroflexi bacterium]|nr:hypothetical protein [Chloroflexota bacterium]